jgi:hypothetical protein
MGGHLDAKQEGFFHVKGKDSSSPSQNVFEFKNLGCW